jgi:hypothetical protein
VLKNSKRCSQIYDSNNDVLSKLVLSDTAWALDVICAGNADKKRCYSFLLGEMKDEETTKVFSKERFQKGGKFSLGSPTLLTVFDSLPFLFLFFKGKKEQKSP